MPQVCGKGQLPAQPLIVKARYFTKEAETKIKEAWPCFCTGAMLSASPGVARTWTDQSFLAASMSAVSDVVSGITMHVISMHVLAGGRRLRPLRLNGCPRIALVTSTRLTAGKNK